MCDLVKEKNVPPYRHSRYILHQWQVSARQVVEDLGLQDLWMTNLKSHEDIFSGSGGTWRTVKIH